MRQMVLDIETTGLYWRTGHQVVELAAVELVDRQLTGRQYHSYLNPGREVDPGAQEVHGLTNEFLADKRKFAEFAGELLDFIRGAELLAHNAPFDIGFLNNELALVGLSSIEGTCARVVDTRMLAREMFPGQRISVDTLCERLQVNAIGRANNHGALVDATCVAHIYMKMGVQ